MKLNQKQKALFAALTPLQKKFTTQILKGKYKRFAIFRRGKKLRGAGEEAKAGFSCRAGKP